MGTDDTRDLLYPVLWLWRARVGIVAAIFVTGFAAYSAVFEPASDPVERRWMWAILIAAGAAVGALVSYHALLSCSLRVSPDGVAEVRRGQVVARLEWHEIERVRYRRILGRLDLTSHRGGGTLSVDEHLEGFDQLVAAVGTRTGRVLERVWF